MFTDDDSGENGALDNDDLLDEEAVLAVKIIFLFPLKAVCF